jgi:hypothetical protein
MITQKQVTERDLKLQAELLYRDIEDYIRKYEGKSFNELLTALRGYSDKGSRERHRNHD